MQIHYDLDGCHGTLASTERTNLPSPTGAALACAIFALMVGAAVVFGVYGLVLFVFLGTMALLGSGGGGANRTLGNFSVEASEAEQPALNWVFAQRRVERPFRVEGHLLTFESQEGERTVDLRNADIRASDAGVFIYPATDEPLELYWDDADLEQAERLANALQNIRDRELGDASEVPEALLRGRERQDS